MVFSANCVPVSLVPVGRAGEVVSKQDYDAEGMQIANEMVENNPSLEVSYEAPTNDAMYRNTNMGMDEYMGGGKIKINPMGYQEGGKVK